MATRPFLSACFSLAALLGIQNAMGFEIIAHRGIYQNYGREDVDSVSCTANKISSPVHSFLENTVNSIETAFDLGASMVELDVHPTTESSSTPERLIVFHDWELTCRTNATCETGCKCNEKHECNTDQQSWDFLKTLDIGYGYTFDGKSYPFRGKAVGMMPTFQEAVSILSKYPTKKLLVNVKDKYQKTQLLLLKELAAFPEEIRSRVYVEFQKPYASDFQKLSVPEAIWQTTGVKQCLNDLITPHPKDKFPASCSGKKYFIPLHQDLSIFDPKLKGVELTAFISGWPDQFLQQAALHGAKIYLSQVNSEADYKFSQGRLIEGIMTDRIEVIGPLVNGN
jgi:glycerophosphoryl diester phosphodiesterase